MSSSLLVIGLGNPGKQYENALHNTGTLVLNRAIEERGLSWGQAPKNIAAVIAKSGYVVYAKPTTYMNESGQATVQLLNFYKLSPANLIVVHDDIDLPMGEVRVEQSRGAGGHNGIQSVIKALGGETSFRRVRVGVATKRTEQKEGRQRDVAKIVLKKPGLFDRKAFNGSIARGVDKLTHMC